MSSPSEMRYQHMPPGWMVPVRGAQTTPVRKNTSNNTKHYESPHYSDGHTLDMKKQEDLGLMPPAWSVTSAMKDERPNGKPQFDARFLNTPMGRARAGRSIVWDPRGTMNSGGPQRLENIDITQVMAKKYAEMTNKAAESAYFAEYYDGVNTLGDDGERAQIDLQLAQMSKLQKKQLDKDGDGSISVAEMEAQGKPEHEAAVGCRHTSQGTPSTSAPITARPHVLSSPPAPALATRLPLPSVSVAGFAFGMHNKSGSDGIISNVHGDVNSDATFVPLEARGGVA